MTNIEQMISCVSCKKIGFKLVCAKCQTRLQHPSVYANVLEYKKQLDEILEKVSVKW